MKIQCESSTEKGHKTYCCISQNISERRNKQFHTILDLHFIKCVGPNVKETCQDFSNLGCKQHWYTRTAAHVEGNRKMS